MSNVTVSSAPSQPNLMSCVLAGFNTAANHAWLLLFPVGLDLWIWLGPHLYLHSLLTGFFDRLNNLVAALASQALAAGSPAVNPWGSAEMEELVLNLQATVIERLNVMFTLRTFPVGVPSVMSGLMPITNPFGISWGIDLPSILVALGAWLLVALAGLALGTLYYQLVAQAALQSELHLSQVLRAWPRQTLSMGIYSLFWFFVIFLCGLPFSCLASLGPGGIGSLATFLYLGCLVFVLYPFIFTGHAIAADQDNVFAASLRSIRLTRLTLPLTSLFILGVLLISQVLEPLWRVPAENSWLTLLAIGGHAFATTGLLAASFVYYRRASQWLLAIFQASARA